MSEIPDEPMSENLKRESVAGFYLTTAVWRNCLGGESYETGVRFEGRFRLLQHDGRDWEKFHNFVKDQILSGLAFNSLVPYEREQDY